MITLISIIVYIIGIPIYCRLFKYKVGKESFDYSEGGGRYEIDAEMITFQSLFWPFILAIGVIFMLPLWILGEFMKLLTKFVKL